MSDLFIKSLLITASLVVIGSGSLFLRDRYIVSIAIDEATAAAERANSRSLIYSLTPANSQTSLEVCHNAVFSAAEMKAAAIWDSGFGIKADPQPDGSTVISGNVSYRDPQTGREPPPRHYRCHLGKDGSIITVSLTS